ncbi:hypothetical protein MJO28_012748 [Puccinia striiformis f. sp. tritici]|uniref:Uncharacterized protein n=1 Tax=Puccinia striiformis f. sp. tritici TaxID=168172 RepID=A0ACC0E260_9BASI|nr:hypothetical protein MJO28_012748 [Puccinia striiformis f. sp. tritici]
MYLGSGLGKVFRPEPDPFTSQIEAQSMLDSASILWLMKFKKNTPNGKPAGTPIPIPTTKTRPPTATIDLTGIDQASPALSSCFQLQGNSPKPNSFPSRYNPCRASQKAPAHDRKTQYEPTTTSFIGTAWPTQNNQQKTIIAGARPSPLALTSPRHLAVNKTFSANSGSRELHPPLPAQAHPPPTQVLPDQLQHPKYSKQVVPYHYLVGVHQPSSNKLPTLDNAREHQSAPHCPSDLHVSRLSTSTESVSIISNTTTTMTTTGPPSIDLLADMQNALLVQGMSLQGHQLTHTTGCDDVQDLDQITTTKTTCLPLIDLLADMQNTLLVRGDVITRGFGQIMPEELSIEMTQMIDNPESLCPFCDELLYKEPLTRFIKLLNYLKNKPGVKQRKGSKNPFALYLPFSDIASCCQLHRAEKNLIPTDKSQLWVPF